MVDASGPTARSGVDELAAAMREAAQVAAGRAVPKRELDLRDAQARRDGVDRHAHLAAEAGREREASLRARQAESAAARTAARGSRARIAARMSCARQCVWRFRSRRRAARRTRRSPGRPRLSTSGRRSPTRSASASRIDPGGRGVLGERERLTLAAPGEPEHARAGALRLGGGRVARAVVGDDHLRAGELLAERRHRRARSCPPRRARRRGSPRGQLTRLAPRSAERSRRRRCP